MSIKLGIVIIAGDSVNETDTTPAFGALLFIALEIRIKENNHLNILFLTYLKQIVLRGYLHF